MWFLIPLLGAAAGAWLGRESPNTVLAMIVIMAIVILIGLGDPAVAVQVLGLFVVAVVGLVILYNIIPILLFLFGAFLALAFIIVVLAGLFKLAGV